MNGTLPERCADLRQILPGAVQLRVDSRQVQAGDWFVAIACEPARSEHVADAVARGASVVVAAAPAPAASVPVILVDDPRAEAARCSVAAHGLDRHCPPLLGVTGTDGKTSVSFFTWLALGGPGHGAARCGTLGFHDGTSERAGTHTTPPCADLHRFLAGLPRSCPGVGLEVSSHAIDQSRLAGLQLAGLAITGIGSDHLDYHPSLEHYVATKLASVRLLRPAARCVIAADDARAAAMRAAAVAAGASPVSLGRDGECRLERDGDGWWLLADGERWPVRPPMPGDYNAWNAAAAALLVEAVGIDRATALARIAAGPAVPGRLERVVDHPAAYVDYAHTPGAIERLLAVLRDAHPGRRLVAVVGCGGDRDRGKRAPMARAACAADAAIFTSDNPRGEDPKAIVADMLAGLAPDERGRVEVVLDRRAAIATALSEAGAEGVVAVCGKGHEREQIIGDARVPFDDRAVVRDLVAGGGR